MWQGNPTDDELDEDGLYKRPNGELLRFADNEHYVREHIQ